MDDAELVERIGQGKLVEGPEHANERYIEGLKRTLIVSGDTELVSAPAYLRAAQHAPRMQSYISVVGIIQDELGHAHIAYRMLRDLGVDTDALIYEREPSDFRYPYAFDVPLDSWYEMVVANGFYDRAGFVLLSDIYEHTSYGPWKRALVKVDREETFHLRHGERWMRTLAQDPEHKPKLQAAVDWMFVMTLEWFGLPDDLKRHKEQLGFGLKGKSNDTLRQEWMSTAVPFCESIGIEVPAHLDERSGKYEIDMPFPVEFDEGEKRWLLEDGAITWDQVLTRWKRRGPSNEEFVEQLQAGYRDLQAGLAA
jgi:ring-1,2-phenylacetyl-CoA epoxidase subunit PaaA